MTTALGIDVGGTGTRWALLRRDGTCMRGEAAGATALPGAQTRAALAETLASIAGALPERPLAVGIGATGAGWPPDPALGAAVAEAFELSVDYIWFSNDIVLAWHAAFPDGGPGHLIAAGTGSVGVTVTPDGPVIVGGRGTLIDDAGGGAWLALRALDAVLRDQDEGRDETPLARALAARIGGLGRTAVNAAVYGGPRGEIARIAPAVADAAEQGDPAATALLEQAGHELARLAQALETRTGPAPLAVTGRALDIHPAILESLSAALLGQEIRRPNLDPARTAANLALRLVVGDRALSLEQ